MDARSHTVCSLNLDPDALALVRSILQLRPEPWRWSQTPADAAWWFVDVDEPVETRTIVRSFDRSVLALASSFSNLPTPQWTYLAKPLRSHMLLRVLDHLCGLAIAGMPGDNAWQAQSLRLLRRPDIPGLHVTPAFLQWCEEMLRRPVPYVQLLAALPATQLHALLADAERQGYLDVTPNPGPGPALLPQAQIATAPSTRWLRLWSR